MSISHNLTINSAYKETSKKHQLMSRKSKREKASKASLQAKCVKLKEAVRKELSDIDREIAELEQSRK